MIITLITGFWLAMCRVVDAWQKAILGWKDIILRLLGGLVDWVLRLLDLIRRVVGATL